MDEFPPLASAMLMNGFNKKEMHRSGLESDCESSDQLFQSERPELETLARQGDSTLGALVFNVMNLHINTRSVIPRMTGGCARPSFENAGPSHALTYFTRFTPANPGLSKTCTTMIHDNDMSRD